MNINNGGVYFPPFFVSDFCPFLFYFFPKFDEVMRESGFWTHNLSDILVRSLLGSVGNVLRETMSTLADTFASSAKKHWQKTGVKTIIDSLHLPWSRRGIESRCDNYSFPLVREWWRKRNSEKRERKRERVVCLVFPPPLIKSRIR